MSSEEESRRIAEQAEKELNSYPAKVGHGGRIIPGYEMKTKKGLTSDSTLESGVDQAVENKFPGAKVKYGGPAPTGRFIPPEEGGGKVLGEHGWRMTKIEDFEGPGGPEDKARQHAEEHPGHDDVRENIRQGQHGTSGHGGQD